MQNKTETIDKKIPDIPIRLVITEGSKEENKKHAEESIRYALKILKLDMNPKIYIDFFNLLYDEWDDAIKAMDHIHERIQFDCYLVHLLKKKNKMEK